MASTQLNNSIKVILQSISSDVQIAVKKILTERKIKSDSDVVKSVDVQFENNFINILANDYIINIDTGRKPNTKKIPVLDLIIFIKKHSLTPPLAESLNELAYIIQNAIYRNGVRGKNILVPVENITEDIISKRIENDFTIAIENDIYNTINKYFK